MSISVEDILKERVDRVREAKLPFNASATCAEAMEERLNAIEGENPGVCIPTVVNRLRRERSELDARNTRSIQPHAMDDGRRWARWRATIGELRRCASMATGGFDFSNFGDIGTSNWLPRRAYCFIMNHPEGYDENWSYHFWFNRGVMMTGYPYVQMFQYGYIQAFAAGAAEVWAQVKEHLTEDERMAL